MNECKKEQATATVGSLTPKSVFAYGGVNWVVLQQVDSGALCLAEKVLLDKAFDEDNRNNWEDSLLREYLNDDFLKECVNNGAAEAAFIPMVVGLTADDGVRLLCTLKSDTLVSVISEV